MKDNVEEGRIILKLAYRVLGMCSEEFSHHICSDIDTKIFKGISDRKGLLKDIKKVMSDEDMAELSDVPDWLLMEYLSKKLKKMSKL